jgi:hypothetical protein
MSGIMSQWKIMRAPGEIFIVEHVAALAEQTAALSAALMIMVTSLTS